MARLLGLARSMLGVSALLTPSLVALPWVGWAQSRPRAVRLFARTLGGRDLALGLGLVVAADRGEPVQPWVHAGALADAGDAIATLLAFRHLPRRSRWAILVLTAGTAIVGMLLATALDGAVALESSETEVPGDRGVGD